MLWCGYVRSSFEVKVETDSNYAMEIKTEADSNDIITCTHYNMASRGMFVFMIIYSLLYLQSSVCDMSVVYNVCYVMSFTFVSSLYLNCRFVYCWDSRFATFGVP